MSTEQKRYRYPGVQSFTKEEVDAFFGRDNDIENIYASVRLNPVTVVFGKSGIGKSSILNAGVIPKLEHYSKNNPKNPYQIIRIETGNFIPKKEIEESKKSLMQIIKEKAFSHTAYKSTSELLELFNESNEKIKNSFWLRLKMYQTLFSTYLIIFDQAEQLFTYPDRDFNVFVNELKLITSKHLPDQLRIFFENELLKNDNDISDELYDKLYTPLDVKLLFSIRSDKLHLLTRLKKAISGILQNSYELLPLTKAQTKRAILEPASLEGDEYISPRFKITEDAFNKIFDGLAAKTTDLDVSEENVIEPYNLQIICQHLERNIVPSDDNKIIEENELPTDMSDITGKYYKHCIEHLVSFEENKLSEEQRSLVQNFIEEEMIYEPDKRRSTLDKAVIVKKKMIELDSDILSNVLDQLVNDKLLKKEMSASNAELYELSHDCLIEAILKVKSERLNKGIRQDPIINKIIKEIEELKGESLLTETNGTFTEQNQLTNEKQAGKTGVATSKNVNKLYDLYKTLGDNYIVIKYYDLALEAYNEAIKIAEQNKLSAIEAYRARSDAYYYNKSYDLSNKDLEKILELNPEDSLATYYMGLNYKYKGDLEKANLFLEKACKLNPENAGIYTEIGNIHFTMKEFERAKEYYLKTLEKDSKADYAFRNIGLVEESLGNIDEALKYYEKSVELNSNSISIYNDIGNIYYNKKNYEKAIEYYQTAFNRDPTFYYAPYNMGLVEEAQGNIDAALKNYKKSAEINPDYLDSYLPMARIYYIKQDYKSAKEICLNLTISNPNNANNYYLLGLTEEAMKNFEAAINNYEKAIQINSSYYEAYIGLARVYFEIKEFYNAKDIYTKLIAINPNDEKNYHDLGLIEEGLQSWNAAIDNYKKAIELNPNYKDALVAIARLYFDRKDYDKAKDIYVKLIEINPRDEKNYHDLGLIEEGLQSWNAAIDNYQRAIQLNPNYEKVYIRLAGIYFDKKDYDKAKEMYAKLILINPDDEKNFHDLGLLEENLYNLDAAVDNYKKAIQLNPNYEDALVAIARLYFDRKDYDKAKEIYTKLISINPNDERNYQDLGLVEENLDNSDAAVDNYKKAIQLNPNYEDALVAIARLYFDRKDYDKAKEIYTKLVSINPNNERNYQELGLTEESLGNWDAAINNYKKATELNPNYEEAYIAMGGIYFDKKDYNKAKEIYIKLISINPENEENYYSLGLIEENLKNWDQAINNYKKAIEINPKYELAIYYLGLAYENRGQINKAIEYYKRSVDLNPPDPNPYNNLGYAYIKVKELSKAEYLLNVAIKKGMMDHTNMNLGHIYLCKNKIEKAIDYYNQSLQNFTNKKDFWKEMDSDFIILNQTHGISIKLFDEVKIKVNNLSDTNKLLVNQSD